ncbi:RNA-directed DNA polymerase [Rhodopseudomonas sp. BR0G17]|uniref:RNA-directed DNA polymerase n=1 Tax=Rhodopseudomonas sp. BR0G17 TaxID=2269368 RepID=UPI0013DE966C|nr:RNA-directed DNA polymerase [Rhodopseudomonas sp. BR0G17]NEW97295.1 hypothetical protein [Rhodopseudomonas sp. BR0G17]
MASFKPKVSDNAVFEAFLNRGFFPEVLPPVFQTKAWAEGVDPTNIELVLPDADLNRIPYSCTKRGYGRRYFDVVHPATAVATAAWMSRHWSEILSYCNEKEAAPIKLSLLQQEDNRAVATCSFDRVLHETKRRLAGARYVVRADIAKFYSSIYTHAIPWALHTKKLAKADRKTASAKIFANDLDWAIRLGQGNQTKGIPIGPDFSRVVGEVIGSAIDREILEKIDGRYVGYLRNIDDFCVGASDLASAEAILHALQEALHSYELELNDEKTGISESSTLIDETWIHEVDNILDGYGSIKTRLIDRAFDRAFKLAELSASDSSLKYLIRAVDRLTSEGVIEFWEVEHNVVRSMVSYPHCLDYCILLFLKQQKLGRDNSKLWKRVIDQELRRHLALSHDHEVSWLLVAVLGAEIDLGKIAFVPDPNRQIVNTLLLQSLDSGRLAFEVSSFLEEVVPDSEVNSNWLLSNEIVANGWSTSSVRARISQRRNQVVGKNISFIKNDFMDDFDLEVSSRAIPDRYNRYDEGSDEDDWDFDEDDLDAQFERAMANDRS